MEKAEIFPKKRHYFANIELYTAQIFPLLPQQLLQWFQQQLQLDFEGGEGTGGSYQPEASKGAPAGGRSSPAFTSSSRSHHSKPSANQEASSNPSANQEASSASVTAEN